jgi:hypothetical protein
MPKTPVILSALTLLLCEAAVVPSARAAVSPHYKDALTALDQQIRGWVRTCDGAMNYGGGCDQGGLTLFAGLLCLSGETARCEDVRRAQDGDGSWWRAPHRIGETGRPVFSRDQTTGLLAYFSATRDTTAARHWLDWVYANGRKLPDFHHLSDDGRAIPPGVELYSVCKDDFHVNCLITPPFWGFFGRVWSFIGLDRTSQMEAGQFLNEDENSLVGEVYLPQKPYERHLSAANLFIHRMIGRAGGAVRKAAARLASEQPTNPFLRFVSEGATDELARLVLAQCPARPLVAEPGDWLWMADSPAVV